MNRATVYFSDAQKDLFGCSLSEKKYKRLRTLVTSLRRNNCIPVIKTKGGGAGIGGECSQRSSVSIKEADYPALYNSVLLLVLFLTVDAVKDVFAQKKHSPSKFSIIAKSVMRDRNSFAEGVEFSDERDAFLDAIMTWDDFNKELLPNPFQKPLLEIYRGDYSLIEVDLMSRERPPAAEKMMLSFVQGRLEAAYGFAQEGPFEADGYALLAGYITQMYEQAQDLDNLLDEIM